MLSGITSRREHTVGTSTRSIRRISRVVGISTGTAVLFVSLGVGPVAAQDEHSGGVSPNEESVDPGVAGKVIERSQASGGGLPVTGSDVAGLVGMGALAVVAGSGALSVSKRRARISA